jgi:hypothetical protein
MTARLRRDRVAREETAGVAAQAGEPLGGFSLRQIGDSHVEIAVQPVAQLVARRVNSTGLLCLNTSRSTASRAGDSLKARTDPSTRQSHCETRQAAGWTVTRTRSSTR